MLRSLALTAALLLVVPAISSGDTEVLGPSGEVLVAPSANDLKQVQSSRLAPAPGASSEQVQADCLTEDGIFYGSDFVSTKHSTTSSAADCCATCKLSSDCTVWNWCGKQDGCSLPTNVATASNTTGYPYQTCIWKPRPLSFAGTLPLPPTSNSSAAMTGWTSGIPINGTLLPALEGFELTTGVDLAYSEDTDFFCTGSSTSKPVCQLYGDAKGGALACLNNPICRGFEICWAFPTSADYYSQTGIIRMKAGAQAPLNITGALQNPYCSIYVLKSGAASAPNSASSGYALRDSYNGSAVQAATAKLISSGRKLLQAPAANNFSSRSSSGSIRDSGSMPALVSIAPTQQEAAAPAQKVSSFSTSPAASKGSQPPSPAPTPQLGSSGRYGTNFTAPFLSGATLQAFSNLTFNYTQCYSDAPSIRVTLQSQLFPLQGPTQVYNVHTWTEVPFRNSGDVCCAFEDLNDIYLDLETGVLAMSLPIFVATDVGLTNGAPLKNYDTTPVSIVEPLVYIPAGQINSPGGEGRQFTFPRINGSTYIAALEDLYFSVVQTALGNRFCTPGFPQLAPAVNFVGDLLSQLSEDGVETPGGIPVGLDLVATQQTNPDGSLNNASCLVEHGVLYEGDTIMSMTSGNATLDSCCQACWNYIDPKSSAQCDVWILNSSAGSCELRNSSLAEAFQPVPTERGATYANYISGRKSAILPSNATNLFTEPDV